MRAKASRLADKLMFGIWVTTNMSQRIGRPLVHLPAPVTFNMSQFAPARLELRDCSAVSLSANCPLYGKQSQTISVSSDRTQVAADLGRAADLSRVQSRATRFPRTIRFAMRHKISGKVAATQLPPKFYILDMFPYPSGAGLHVGHPEGYTATDILARYKRAQGFNVLHPMGWDAFGLPAEQYAVKTGQHPRKTTEANIATFTRQIKSLGFSYDWSRELATTDPDYFKWTQWIFLKLYNSWFNPETNKAEPIETLKYPAEWQILPFAGLHDENANARNARIERRQYRDSKRLAYVSEAPVWWCEQLGTVLANEEVVDGKSEVGGFPVVRKPMRQWMLRITAYAERLLQTSTRLTGAIRSRKCSGIGLAAAKARKWIFKLRSCRSSAGDLHESRRRYPRFHNATRHTFRRDLMVLAPEHPLVDEITTRNNGRRLKNTKAYAVPKIRPRTHRTRQGKNRRVHRRLCHQSGQRRKDSDLDCRLRSRELRHRRNHGRARA